MNQFSFRRRRSLSAPSGCSTASVSTSGFTVVELLIVLIIVGVLAGLIVPAWQHLLAAQRVNRARDQVFQTMRTAQQQADLQNRTWQASFREAENGRLQGAAHPVTALPQTIAWEPFQPKTQIDQTATTLYQSDGVYRIRFNPKGGVNGRLGRMTVRGDRHEMPKRCVFVSTLLGTLRKASDTRCNR